ncbi:MAG: NAD(P)/FAD-dependent oxidoreductase, partial [Flavobacteriales bacterium]
MNYSKEISIDALSMVGSINDELDRQVMPTAGALFYRISRKSIDARHGKVTFRIQLEFSNDPFCDNTHQRYFENFPQIISDSTRVVIVGAGPAGYFAALQLLKSGISPIIIDRGKDVRSRRRDLVKIHRDHKVNPDSNYCFGEGGAGAYSDGKLYTRILKRGSVLGILEAFVAFGADPSILTDAHPHIGTNKLPGILSSMREFIVSRGGQIHFDTRLVDLTMKEGAIQNLWDQNGNRFDCDKVILATGHGASDVYELLIAKGINLDFKPFAVGVRAEHPQSWVDSIQYKCVERPPILPAAEYRLVEQIDGRGVYSFCMCPGGIIAPCATEDGLVVTNGWSPSKRNNRFANSGIVVPIDWSDVKTFHHFGALAGMHFQRSIERKACQLAGSNQTAPAQRLIDFVNDTVSSGSMVTSYQPGTVSVRMDDVFPAFINAKLRSAFKAFDRKMPGYLHPESVLVAPETRTSSVVTIPRDKQLLFNPQCKNLYPCGEGAGYAGGIVSAAMDGERVADAVALSMVIKK